MRSPAAFVSPVSSKQSVGVVEFSTGWPVKFVDSGAELYVNGVELGVQEARNTHPSAGQRTTPIKFAAVNCDLGHSVVMNNRGVTCIYRPIKPIEAKPE
jgi:hypothetical protein